MSTLYSFLQTLWDEAEADTRPPTSDTGYYFADSPQIEVQEDNGSLVIQSDKLAKFTAGNYKNIRVSLECEENAEVILKNVQNAVVRTHDGDDYIDIVGASEAREKAQVQVFANQGHDMIVLHSNAFYNVTYRLYGGDGDDRLISSGRNRVLFHGGDGNDVIIPSEGTNMILGGEGKDEVVFFQEQSSYHIRMIEKNHLEVSITAPDGTSESLHTLIGVETLRFKDGVINISQGLLDQNSADDMFSGTKAWQRFSFEQDNFVASFDLKSLLSYFYRNAESPETRYDQFISVEETLNADTSTALPDIEPSVSSNVAIQNFKEEIEAPFDLSGYKDKLFEVSGGRDDDHLFAGIEDSLLVGNEGDDNLYGWKGDDVLVGGAGNDYFEGNLGNDILIGGSGEDTAFYWGFSAEFELDLYNKTLADQDAFYGTDRLISIEKLGFIDATYQIDETGIEKIDNGFFKFSWGNFGSLKVVENMSQKNDEPVSYQTSSSDEDVALALSVDV